MSILKRVGILLLLISLVLGFSVSGVFAADTIKIGYLAALTGDWAIFSQTEVKGAQIAVDEINAQGGVLAKQVELVIYDTRGRAEDAVNAVRRMIEEDKVVVIVGSNSSGINIATGPVVNRYKIPQLGTVTTNPLVTVDAKGNVYPYSFRLCFTDPYQGKLIAYFCVKDLNKMNAAILYDVGSDYSQGLREFFMKSYKEYGGKVVADLAFHAGADVDFRAQLTEIRGKKADVLILPIAGKEMALIMKQTRELGMGDIIFVSGDGLGPYMFEIAGDAMEGAYGINHVALEDPALAPFFAAYKAKYNDECAEFLNGVFGYDGIYLMIDAIKRAGSDDPTLIAKALAASNGVQLHHAVITMDEFHNPKDKEGVVLIAKDGKLQFFKKIKF